MMHKYFFVEFPLKCCVVGCCFIPSKVYHDCKLWLFNILPFLMHVNGAEPTQTCAPICELCDTQKPKDVTTKYSTWSCKFCTLENTVKLEKCSACDQWRYSHGPPLSTWQ